MKQLTDEQKHFREIVRAYHTELVLHPGGWGDDLIPLWQNQVIRQRLEMIDNGGWNKATDTEVAIYLSAASGVAPFDRDWTDIFVYEVSLLMGNAVYNALGEPNNGLTDYQKTEVEHLKHQIRDKQIKVEKKGVAMLKNKILIEEREDGTLFGVDPYVKKLGLTWEQTIAQLPFLREITSIAEEQWKLSPKNPSYAPAPKPEVKKLELAKKVAPKKSLEAPGAKIGQPALTIEKPADEISQAPITSVAEAKTNSPSEVVAEISKNSEEPKILAPIASVAEPMQKSVTPPVPNTGTPGLISQTPVTMSPCGTSPGGTPHNSDNLSEPEIIPGTEANVQALEHAIATGEPVKVELVPQTKARTSADAFQYKLKDGRGPVATVQEALDLLGVDKATRPTHNRYDRLSKKLQGEIIQEKKV
jgi:hypothetical protein